MDDSKEQIKETRQPLWKRVAYTIGLATISASAVVGVVAFYYILCPSLPWGCPASMTTTTTTSTTTTTIDPWSPLPPREPKDPTQTILCEAESDTLVNYCRDARALLMACERNNGMGYEPCYRICIRRTRLEFPTYSALDEFICKPKTLEECNDLYLQDWNLNLPFPNEETTLLVYGNTAEPKCIQIFWDGLFYKGGISRMNEVHVYSLESGGDYSVKIFGNITDEFSSEWSCLQEDQTENLPILTEFPLKASGTETSIYVYRSSARIRTIQPEKCEITRTDGWKEYQGE